MFEQPERGATFSTGEHWPSEYDRSLWTYEGIAPYYFSGAEAIRL